MSGGRLSWKARERGPARQGPAAQPPRRSRGGQPRAPSGKKTCQKHRNRTVVWRGSTPLNSGRQKGGRRKGKKERDVQSPPSPRAAHLDEAPLGTAATRLFPARPRPVVQLAPHFQSHSYCRLGKQALSLGLQLLLGAGHLPSSPGPGGFGPESSQGWGPGSEGGVITLQWPGRGFGFLSTLPAVPVPPAAPLRAP